MFEEKAVQHYIPWRVVYNPKSKSTPVRPVMDASSRTPTRPDGRGGRCLNDLVCKGRIETLNLVRLVLKFVMGRYALTGDLSQFYNCLRLREEFWNLQRFLWRENLELKEEVLEAIIVTLMYGVKRYCIHFLFILLILSLSAEKRSHFNFNFNFNLFIHVFLPY